MKYRVSMEFPKIDTLELEIDESLSPRTVKKILGNLPFSIPINSWGEELYTNETEIDEMEENPKEVVELFDVAYWPPGKAICLFFGPTPIGKKGEIKPYSPVNVIGKIKTPDKKFIDLVKDGMTVTFRRVR